MAQQAVAVEGADRGQAGVARPRAASAVGFAEVEIELGRHLREEKDRYEVPAGELDVVLPRLVELLKDEWYDDRELLKALKGGND